MKFEFTQPFAGFAMGETKDSEVSPYVHNVPLLELERIGILKVSKPVPPKFKVGDYAVHRTNGRMMRIGHILPSGNDVTYEGYKESELREPTEEELQTYFR